MSYKATMSKKVQVNEKKFCKMCFDAKREGYDTHYLKDFTGPEVKVVCPYLLALQCNYCKEQGHTISYCPILKTKETKPAKQQQHETGAGVAGNKRIYSLRADNDQTPYPNKDWLFDRETETYIRIPPPPRLVRQNAIAVDNNTGDYGPPMATTKTKTKGNSVKTTNAYESLFDSESDEEETAPFSSTAVAVPLPAPQTESRLWADIAAKIPVQQKKRVQFQEQTQTQTQTQTHHQPLPLPELPSFTLKKKTPLTDAFFKYTPMSNWADDSDSEDN